MGYNAANAEHVRGADRIRRRRQRDFTVALHAVLQTAEGRRVFGDPEFGVLGRCRVYGSVFDASGSRVYYNAGRQDVGHELMALLVEVDERAFMQMQDEMRALARRDRHEAEASTTGAASERG